MYIIADCTSLPIDNCHSQPLPKVLHPADVKVVTDFCAGGGHVGLLVAYLNPDVSVHLVENKEESLDNARQKVSDLDLHNVTMYQVRLIMFSCNRAELAV